MSKSTVRADDTDPDLSRAQQIAVEEKTAAIAERAIRGHEQLDAEDSLTHHVRLVLDSDERTARLVEEIVTEHLNGVQDCPFCNGSNTAGPSEIGQNTECSHCGPSGQVPLFPHELGDSLKLCVEELTLIYADGGRREVSPMARELIETALGWVDWTKIAASYIEDMSAEVKARGCSLEARAERPLFTAKLHGRDGFPATQIVDVFSIDAGKRHAEISAAPSDRQTGRRICPLGDLSSFQVMRRPPAEVICPKCGSNDVTEVEEEHYCEACRDYFA